MGSASISICFPIATSILIVFLFAGPHNWLELRYLLGRLPARWGAHLPYFLVALSGFVLLTSSFICLSLWSRVSEPSYAAIERGYAAWSVALVLWLLGLGMVQARLDASNRFEGSWQLRWLVAMCCLALACLGWMSPARFLLALAYIHPLFSLVFLYRAIRKRWPRQSLALPLLWTVVAGLAVVALLSDAVPAESAAESLLGMRIAWQAGTQLLPFPARSLIALHVFLELLHYGVWVIALPLLTFKEAPLSVEKIPLARKSSEWRKAIQLALLLSLFCAALLWIGFACDYGTTRDLYFLVAIGHVVAEFPFLIRAR